LPHKNRLDKLGLWTLKERRNRADLIEVFKIVKGLSASPWSQCFKKARDTATRGHTWKFVKNYCHSDIQYLLQTALNANPNP